MGPTAVPARGPARPPRSAFRPTLPRVPKIAPAKPAPSPERAESAPSPERQPDDTLPPGTWIGGEGRYEIVEPIAEGGVARVYKAYHPALDRYVAIKVLKPGLPPSNGARMWREAKLGACFSHANLVHAIDAGSGPSGIVWMAMDYLRGRDLAGRLETGGPVRLADTVSILCQVLDALEYVHARSIVHLDVKPENIFLTRDPRDRRILVVKLVDFGIHRDLTPPVIVEEFLSGDPRYMAPEQTVLNGPLDGRADIYALGICLFELATGRHPFEDKFDGSLRNLIEAHRHQPVPRPSEFVRRSRRVAKALDRTIQTACAKRPSDRFPDTASMRAALERIGQLTGSVDVAA